MSRSSATLVVLVLFGAAPLLAQEPRFEEDVRDFIARHCALCHDDFEPEADLDLARFSTAEGALAEREIWFAVEERLLTGEMPPNTEPEPPARELEAALAWIDTDGDPDGDGFVEYHRKNDDGLVNQGWKDSHDSVFHRDGRTAEGPIALCEVQGYVFAAKRLAAVMARALGMAAAAATLQRPHAMPGEYSHGVVASQSGLCIPATERPPGLSVTPKSEPG